MDFDSLLKLMVHKNASDMFITPGVAPSLKVNGRITPVTQATLTPPQAEEIVNSIMSPKQREEFANHNECNFAISASGIGRFRVSAFRQRNHAGMVLRKIAALNVSRSASPVTDNDREPTDPPRPLNCSRLHWRL